jgi:hypothetical protein
MRRLTAGTALFLLGPLFLFAATPIDSDPRVNGTFVAPIPNVPFTAVDKMEQTRIDPDGSMVKLKTTRAIARDRQGRIYKVARLLRPFAETATPPIYMIEFYDPQTKIYTLIYPRSRTFWKGNLDRTPNRLAQEYFYGLPMHNGLPVYKFSKEEELGTQSMLNMPVHGIRETQELENSTGKNTIGTDEYWYSDDLRMSLVAEHKFPNGGSLSVTVTQITRAEPDPALFEIPANYRQLDRPEE